MQKKQPTLLYIISSKPYIIALLCLSIILSLFFVLYKNTSSPPCLNADEAAFGYNAYSILHTGADEYGTVFPLRLKSFGDYKMPLYSYLSIPFVGVLGLNDLSTRALNIFLAVLFPIALYFLVRELFEKDEIAVIAALLVSVSLGMGIMERQAHEAILATFLITIVAYFFIRFLKKETYKNAILCILLLTLALFSYQSSRLFAAVFFVFAIGYFLFHKKKNKTRTFFIAVFVVAIALFTVTDIINKPARVQNLFLTNTAGFSLRINELIGEGGSRIAYNKLTMGVRDVLSNQFTYYSPQFLAINGDSNLRFGFPRMSPMTLFEYIFIFIGIYFLFKNKERWRYFLLILFLIAPLTAALSWAEISLTRSLFLLILALILSSYGIYQSLVIAKQKKVFPYVLVLFILIESLFLFYSWDFYLNHYPKRATVVRSWQCGYKELTTYVKNNYNNYNTFYITQKNGEPYIFMLYYLSYPPKKYQQKASLTAPDKFGFGQVEKFDKFKFNIPATALREKHVVLIGYPDDFNNLPIDKNKIKKIKIDTEEIFWIYET